MSIFTDPIKIRCSNTVFIFTGLYIMQKNHFPPPKINNFLSLPHKNI